MNLSSEVASKFLKSAHTAEQNAEQILDKKKLTVAQEVREPLSVPVTCVDCNRRSCRRSDRTSFVDRVMTLRGLYPWGCTFCMSRFYLRRSS